MPLGKSPRAGPENFLADDGYATYHDDAFRKILSSHYLIQVFIAVETALPINLRPIKKNDSERTRD